MFQNPFTGSTCSKAFYTLSILTLTTFISQAQKPLQWQDVSAQFGSLPQSVQVFKTTDSVDGKTNIAFYVKADLKDKDLQFTADTTQNRRFTPDQFFKKNGSPLVVVNTTFFSFATHQNLNAVIKEGRLVAHNVSSIKGRGKDTLTYLHVFGSAIGIS